jgi:3-hydroxy-9,10-secoandrosta-1,3,5(10)-triene-9,17-dione monooxygenase reductase component
MEYKEKIVDTRLFRDVMGRFVTGITLVTVYEDGYPHGMTVNSFTSVSLDPALILVCLDKNATTTDVVQRTGRFAVNILSADQEHLARQFADDENERDRFKGLTYTLSDEETPILNDVLGFLSCTVKDAVDGGDHVIFIAEVADLAHDDDDRKPLAYYRGNYKTLADEG